MNSDPYNNTHCQSWQSQLQCLKTGLSRGASASSAESVQGGPFPVGVAPVPKGWMGVSHQSCAQGQVTSNSLAVSFQALSLPSAKSE